LNLSLQGPTTTIFTGCNKVEAFKNKIKLWQNLTAERNYKMFKAFSDFIKEEGNFDAKGVAEIITNHLKALLTTFETYYPEHDDPRKQNMWIINPFIEHKGTSLPYKELEELSLDKELEMLFKSMNALQF
jgi:hypothetical protein